MARLLAWTLAAFSLLATTAGAQTQTPLRGGTLNFAVVAEPPNYDCHSNVTFGARRGCACRTSPNESSALGQYLHSRSIHVQSGTDSPCGNLP